VKSGRGRKQTENGCWEVAIKEAASPERVRQWLGQLQASQAGKLIATATAEQCKALAALFSGSPISAQRLLTHPEWLEAFMDVEMLRHPRKAQGLRLEVAGLLEPTLASQDYQEALRRLRLFQQRELVRIAMRDLAGFGDVMEIVRELSDLADACLAAVARVCHQQLSARMGQPYFQDASRRWQPATFCVLGLGKLGGQELNYSSDVDVMFVYSDEGAVFKTPPRHGETGARNPGNHQFFTRLAEMFVAEVGRTTPEGQLYRIDLRLRPEGKAGPLARSLESYENYYAQWGQTWERMMLIKARCVAGDEALAHEFIETVQSFRYPRYVSPRLFDEVAAVKERIENEVVREGELSRNVKLGRGGIREIEFIAQAFQVLHGGRLPFLQDHQTLPALQKLVRYNLMEREDAVALADVYQFLRKVEHRLQMENHQQTHTIPDEPEALTRLAKLMGCRTRDEFERLLSKNTSRVRAIYERLLKTEKAPEHELLPARIEGAEEEWQALLAAHSFRDPVKAFKLIAEFIQGPGYVHVSAHTEELARELVPRLLALCPKKDATGRIVNLQPRTLSDPDRVLARLDGFISAYGSRAMLYESWARNPALFELLILLFDRSEFLAETAIRTPDMVDDLMLRGLLNRSKTAADILEELRHGREDEDQKLWLRRYHETEFMRIGLRDILGLAGPEQHLLELTALADACLQYALEAAMRAQKISRPPVAIIGMGKLGGRELTYGSDLDVIFVAPDSAKNLPKLQSLAVAVLDLLSTQTAQGLVFRTDTRLRPDGEKGLLVNTLSAYEDYYRRRAQLWEIQALTRARPIAGDAQTAQKYDELVGRLTNFKSPSLPLAAYTPDWMEKIKRMRLRIEKERTPAGKEELAFKTGAGGLVDAEFIAQALSLAHGLREPNTLAALQLIRERKLMPAGDAEKLIENYMKLRRIEGILRRWSYEGESELPDDPAPYYRVSVRCGFATPEEFRQAIAGWRRDIRQVYNRIFGGPPAATT